MNVILKISASWQEISFLSNFNILVGMLLGPTDLVESSEDMIRAASCLSVGLQKKFLSSIFQKVLSHISLNKHFYSHKSVYENI